MANPQYFQFFGSGLSQALCVWFCEAVNGDNESRKKNQIFATGNSTGAPQKFTKQSILPSF
jgi:hypothetical protein